MRGPCCRRSSCWTACSRKSRWCVYWRGYSRSNSSPTSEPAARLARVVGVSIIKVWLVTAGEPLPLGKQEQRLLRAGLLARYLVAAGHEVTWWTSTFDHTSKLH